jgi:hypothetical protein
MWHWAGAKVSHLEDGRDRLFISYLVLPLSPFFGSGLPVVEEGEHGVIGSQQFSPHGFLCGFLGASDAGLGIGSELATSASRWPACGALESSSGAGDADNSDGQNFT